MWAVYGRSDQSERWKHVMTCSLEELAEAEANFLVRSGHSREARSIKMNVADVPDELSVGFFVSLDLARDLDRVLVEIGSDEEVSERLSEMIDDTFEYPSELHMEQMAAHVAAQREFEVFLGKL